MDVEKKTIPAVNRKHILDTSFVKTAYHKRCILFFYNELREHYTKFFNYTSISVVLWIHAEYWQQIDAGGHLVARG